MEERGVIDVERDFADDRDDVFPIFEIVNPDVLRDQAANGIEREAAHRGFDAALMQLFDDPLAPLFAEPAFSQIPAAPGEEEDNADDREAQNSVGEGTMRPGAAPVELARERGWSWLQNGRHGETSNVQRPTSNVSTGRRRRHCHVRPLGGVLCHFHN
jgi:hypothetical protein